MGVGKTTFVKYLINNFQLKFNEKLTEVTSPTFNIMNEYNINNLTIKHYDLYRLKSVEEINNLNLFEKILRKIKLIFEKVFRFFFNKKELFNNSNLFDFQNNAGVFDETAFDDFTEYDSQFQKLNDTTKYSAMPDNRGFFNKLLNPFLI